MTERFTEAWLSGDPRADGRLPVDFRRPEDRAAAVARARSVGVPRVVTGQQMGLLLGPLYTIYKAAGAVSVARALSLETGTACEPAFWLQTEDHDLPEIDHCVVPGSGGALRTVRLARDPPEGQCSVGALPLGEGIGAVLGRLEQTLDGLPYADDTVSLFARHYRPEATFSGAFSGVLMELFAGTGLEVVDPRSPDIAAASGPIHSRALREALPVSEALAARSAELKVAGFQAQVHVRPGSPLAFFHPEGPDGPRYRLIPDDDGWRLLGTERTVSTGAVLAACATDPRHLSTSALLRPLVQDSVLATAAYVGGPSEVAYFAQLAPAYEHLGIAMPLVIPRPRFRLVPPRILRQLSRRGLEPDDTRSGIEVALARIGDAQGREPPAEATTRRLMEGFERTMGDLKPELKRLDPGLLKAAARAERAVGDAVRKLADRYARAVLAEDAASVRAVETACRTLQPLGAPQERVWSLAWPAAQVGPRQLIQRVLGACVPFDWQLRDLTL